MLKVDLIPKEIRAEVLSATVTYDYNFLKQIVDKYDLIPSDFCGSCGTTKRNYVFKWLQHVKNTQPNFFKGEKWQIQQ